jgi:hypothetical protein
LIHFIELLREIGEFINKVKNNYLLYNKDLGMAAKGGIIRGENKGVNKEWEGREEDQ